MLTTLSERGADVVRFDTETYPGDSDVAFAVVNGVAHVRLRIAGRELSGADVTAILYRHRRLPRAPTVAETARSLAESELRATLDGALLALAGRWVNHPHANRLARHKLLQLTLAADVGLPVPETLVSADPGAIRRRFESWEGRMVAKLAGGQVAPIGDDPYAVLTTRLAASDLADDAALSACPALYQREVPKAHELRATVVGDRVLTCRIDAPEAADWREMGRAAVAAAPTDLDKDVAARCVALTRRLGLRFAGIDLIVTPGGQAVFLELNAAGQWAWVEKATGLPIAAAIADELTRAGA